ncbi:unnamed protein product [Thelazia callipaeda]|uniref:ACB domain-containing protein n=1 Tax=Thelazia callipaeda TaxID=103827 RepID=A0A0N5CLQ8_THECL|nr:unnamed protein product [Thelazia callipaeda]
MENDRSYNDSIFQAAVDIAQNIPKKGLISISLNEKLELYSLFKQGTVGECNIPCPPFWNTAERLKWVFFMHSWNSLGSMKSVEARKLYIRQFKGIINRGLCEYDFKELLKRSDERTKQLLRVKLPILGYGTHVFLKHLNFCLSRSEMDEQSDRYSVSSTYSDEFFDASCDQVGYIFP